MELRQYEKIVKRIEAQIHNETDWLSNLSNVSAILGRMVEDVNWIGFYLHKDGVLKLGPFSGNPAVSTIEIGKGVCGITAEKRETTIVPNVHDFPGHIVCDIISQSEIVVPLLDGDRLIGVLDVDSPTLERFNEEDHQGFLKIIECINNFTTWSDF